MEPVETLSAAIDPEALSNYGNSRLALEAALQDHRSRRALEAYTALAHHRQRDYVSRVLGIDEYA